MPYAILLAPEAVADLKSLPANVRATVRTALDHPKVVREAHEAVMALRAKAGWPAAPPQRG